MLSTCANPECSEPFLRLSRGRLFVDNLKKGTNREHPTSLEFFWLCELCSPRFTLVAGPDGRIVCRTQTESRGEGQNAQVVSI